MQYETHHCFLLCFFFSQEREAVRSAAVWVIVSPIVPSWRPCRPSRLPTSAAGTVWPTAPWTSKALDFLTLWRGSDEIFLRVVLEWREVLVGRKKNISQKTQELRISWTFIPVQFCFVFWTVIMTGFVKMSILNVCLVTHFTLLSQCFYYNCLLPVGCLNILSCYDWLKLSKKHDKL